MNLSNIGVNGAKFVLLLGGMIACVLLVITDATPWEDVDHIFTAIVFYAIGNGVNSLRGEGTRSVFEPKVKDA